MGREEIQRMRRVENAKIRGVAEKKFYEKVQMHYNPIKRFVDNEIEKSGNVISAIDKVLDNANLSRIYPELNEFAVKRKIRNLLIATYFAKDGQAKENQGEER